MKVLEGKRLMKKLMACLIVLLLAFSVFAVSVADSKNSDLVSYGVIRSKGGQSVPVFDGIGSDKKTDLLSADQLCALDFSSLQGKYYWHHIVYLDDVGQPKDGYVKESNFEQLTLAGLMKEMTDPAKTQIISQLMELAESSPLFLGEPTVKYTSAAAGTVGNSDPKTTYILNTNTHKFHKPSCGSVKKMKEKNKKSYTGTRNEVISMGYVPCKNCNP